MSREHLKKEQTPPDLEEFYKLVVKGFKKNPSVVDIEDVADNLIERDRFKQFEVEAQGIRKKLEKFLGKEKWEKLRVEEAHRIIKADKTNKGATPG